MTGTSETTGPETVREGRFVCVRDSPPGPGDTLCRLLTGRSEADFVRDFIAGFYDDSPQGEAV